MAEDLIVSNPELLGGKPCVRGTRLSVEFLLELAGSGATHDQILARYPQLSPEGLAKGAARELYADFARWKLSRGERAPSEVTWSERVLLLPGIVKTKSNSGAKYCGLALQSGSTADDFA